MSLKVRNIQNQMNSRDADTKYSIIKQNNRSTVPIFRSNIFT